jgi:hypothetical protein
MQLIEQLVLVHCGVRVALAAAVMVCHMYCSDVVCMQVCVASDVMLTAMLLDRVWIPVTPTSCPQHLKITRDANRNMMPATYQPTCCASAAAAAADRPPSHLSRSALRAASAST